MTEFILLQRPFIKKLRKIVKLLTKKLDDYIDDPNKDNIHDIRIAIRRMEAAYRILPKKIRNKVEIQNYVKQTKLLFKINTQIRDIDIICDKFEKEYNTQFLTLVNSMRIKQKSQLKTAHQLALKLRDVRLPKIKNIIESKLQRRFHKILTELNTAINLNIPVVISDDRKIEELHKLRKDFKKLRYTLELVSNENIPIKSLKILKKIQDDLGEIHDSDIMLDYLRGVNGPAQLVEVVRKEILERREKYQRLIQTFRNNKFEPENLVSKL